MLSYVNTQLRDNYSSLEDFCAAADADCEEVSRRLGEIGYKYSAEENAFVRA